MTLVPLTLDRHLPTTTEKELIESTREYIVRREEEDRLDKKDRYISAAKKVSLYTLAGAGLGAIAGAVIGGISGFVMFNYAGIVPGLVLGAKIGLPLGAAIGLGYGVYNLKVEFLCSLKYSEWVEQARITDVFPIYQKMLRDDPRFHPFLCPHKNDLITVPMLDPQGQIYEQANIIEEIRRREQTDHPLPISADDLQYDHTYHRRLSVLVDIKLKELENQASHDIFRNAMQQLAETHRSNRKTMLDELTGRATDLILKNDYDLSLLAESHRLIQERLKTLERDDHPHGLNQATRSSFWDRFIRSLNDLLFET